MKMFTVQIRRGIPPGAWGEDQYLTQAMLNRDLVLHGNVLRDRPGSARDHSGICLEKGETTENHFEDGGCEQADENTMSVGQPTIPCSLKVYPLRLTPDTEIRSSLMSYVKSLGLKAAFIITCCGSVKMATLRYATGPDGVEKIETLRQCFEITSLVGTVSLDGAHLHVTLGNADGATVSGHVMGDLVVQTTAEIVLGEAVGASFTRVYDSATGWPELEIKQTEEK